MRKKFEKVEYGWLQISDLHIFDNTEWKVMENAYNNFEYKEYVKFILLTGDLHNFKENYCKTKVFLENILECFNLSKKDIFIIPGNHDAGECNAKKAFTYYIEKEIDNDQDCYREYFVKGKLVDCFSDYNAFIKDFYGEYADTFYPNPEQVNVRTWNNRLNIIHLNTAINCNGDNSLKQIIDIYNLSNLGSKLKNFPSIIIAHHPMETIHQSHERYLIRFMTDWNVSAYLCGDLHKKNKRNIELFSGRWIPEFVCGKAAPQIKDKYSDLGCILYLKKGGENKIQVCPFKWDMDSKRFNYYCGFETDSGVFEFDLIQPQPSVYTEKKKGAESIKGESIWLPDAETATGTQARFDTFTSTRVIEDFLKPDSNICGVCAVKGVGKTFILQIKRAQMSNKKICLPLGVKPSASNNWGTDTVTFQTTGSLSCLRSFNNVIIFWKYLIIVYVINQLINHLQVEEGEMEEIAELKKLIDSWHRDSKIGEDTYLRCTDETFCDIEVIAKNIIIDTNWIKSVDVEINVLCLIKHKLFKILNKIKRQSILIFIDKVDQSIQEINAEPPVECSVCEKQNQVSICSNPNKSLKYCWDNGTVCKFQCCYGCETYTVPQNLSLRIYSEENGQYRHINIWQYFQLGLLVATSQIKTDFQNSIEVNYTIRKESFACEENLLGQNSKKTLYSYVELHYSKEEQRKIFCECIGNQDPDYLYEPSLARVEGREEEAFVGVKTLCHPYNLALSESVFDSIYRHSFDRARDIQEYGKVLTEHMSEIKNIDTVLGRGEKVKELIEETAAELAFNNDPSLSSGNVCYYYEKFSVLPRFWQQTNNFKQLLGLFEKNLMFIRDVHDICKKFNGLNRCRGNCMKCEAIHHPFSMLYKLGMLGLIPMSLSRAGNVTQEFLDSNKVTYITGNDLLNVNRDCIYILHPALTKSIDKLKRKKIMHFSLFILGKGMSVPQDKLLQLVADYRNNEIKKNDFNSKYYAKEMKRD